MTLTPLKSIRAYCLWCCCGSSPEVRICPSEKCALWPYRHGHNPKRARTGLTATYIVDEKMTARRAIFAKCLDCQQKTRGDCKVPDCQLHHVRYAKNAPSCSRNASTPKSSDAAARSRELTGEHHAR